MIRAKTPQEQAGSWLQAVRASAWPVLACLLLTALASCSGGGSVQPLTGSAPGSSTQTPKSADATAAAEPSASPAGEESGVDAATSRLKETLGNALRSVAAANPKPAQEQVAAALTGAGIPAGSLQISASRTPTGLEVDAIEAAALQGKDCVIGQIRDGSVVVTVLPVLASGKCFVGGPA